MRTLLPVLALLVTGCAANEPAPLFFDDRPPDAAEAIDPAVVRAWIQGFHGEWEVTNRMITASGTGGTTWSHRETALGVGANWVVVEGIGATGGVPFHARLTIGHDSLTDGIVGTWVDSMQTQMWTFTGDLDPEANVLVLEAVGPSWEDTEQRTLYRETIEFLSPDHRRMTSSVQGADGAWTEYLQQDARRRTE